MKIHAPNTFIFYSFIIGLFTLLSGCSSLQPNPINEQKNNADNSRLAVEFLRLDLDQIISSIIEVHPDPFAVISKQDFFDDVDSVKRSFHYPLLRSEFYLRVAPLIAKLGDIHSRIEIPSSVWHKSTDDFKAETSNNKIFPLAVLYEKNKLYVAADLSEQPQVPAGATITAINHAPTKFLLQVMTRLTAKETQAGVRRRIQIDFPWLLAAIGYAKQDYSITYYWQGVEYNKQLAGIGLPLNRVLTQDENNLVATGEEQNNDKQDVNKQDVSDHSAQGDKPFINGSNSKISFYGFSQLSNQTALLWFNDFNEHPPVFSSFLKRQFGQLAAQGLTNLIIDVRYNDGGLSQNIRTLLSYITEQPIFWAKQGQITISKPLKKLHHRKTKQRRKNKFQWGLQWLPLEWVNWLQYQISWSDIGQKITVDFEPIEPAEMPTPAHIKVLTNGFCYSACSSFVATVNRYRLAQTLGEIAGNYAKVQYAYPIKIKLTYSQLSLMLPTMKLLIDPEITDRHAIMNEENNFILPQQPVERNHQQIIDRQDEVLNQALKQLESITKPPTKSP